MYADHLRNGLLYGAIEVDDNGRTNIIWAAGKETGFRYEAGQFNGPCDAIRIALPLLPGERHAFPDNSTRFTAVTCHDCGEKITK